MKKTFMMLYGMSISIYIVLKISDDKGATFTPSKESTLPQARFHSNVQTF